MKNKNTLGWRIFNQEYFFIAIVGGIFLYKWNHFKCL